MGLLTINLVMKTSDILHKFIQWHVSAPCNQSGLRKLRPKLTARREWLLQCDDFVRSSGETWPHAARRRQTAGGGPVSTEAV
jgi:hypothetical protein